LKLSEIDQAYGSAFEKGRLPYLSCNGCSHVFYYPRDACPNCGSKELDLHESSGKGYIFSYTTVHRKGLKDSIYAIVQVEEGFRLYSNILSSGEPKIDDRVVVTFKEVKGRRYPFFELSTS
jgi:uncharacterized OB-fold protein